MGSYYFKQDQGRPLVFTLKRPQSLLSLSQSPTTPARSSIPPRSPMARAPKAKQLICQVEGCRRGRKPFTRRADLERHHSNVHTDVRFECPICGHRTGQRSNLENHIRTQLKCPSCDFEANSTSLIHNHRVNTHNYKPGKRKSKPALPIEALLNPAPPYPGCWGGTQHSGDGDAAGDELWAQDEL
ncbi:hypothetical protein D9758_009567 [Tetrapyrgos nigripes]|uniref:C2H2-type domain-containing protein n=1 Tax=Tetrapyrgos nigripes TaxID=182062 RepID=A0A8H5GD42_9AGAR|nr:hypothetical protein D9758_009567 [Tetrapyrgos nigripes]